MYRYLQNSLNFQDSLRVLLSFALWAIALFVCGGDAARKSDKYELLFTGAKMDHFNPEFVGPGSFFRVSQNKKQRVPVLNAFIPLIKELPADTNTSWRTFTKVRDRWQEALVRGHMSLCSLFETNVVAYKAIYSRSNFPSSCPVPKGNYTITDYMFDSGELPPVAVGKEWKVRNCWTTGSTQILRFTMEVKIDRTIANG